MAEIKAILWDIDGTLLSFKKAEKSAIKSCFSQLSMEPCSDEMVARYSEINDGYWRRLERGELTRQQVLLGRFRDFFAIYGLDTGLAEEFNALYQKSLGEYIFFNDGALEAVERLKGQVAQYAVTNGTKIAQERKLEKSGLNTLLDGVFISEDVGVEKPMLGFFQAVFEQIGAYEKDEILIVGDSLTSDMQGGVNAGIMTCWYNPDGRENTSGLCPDYEIQHIDVIFKILEGF